MLFSSAKQKHTNLDVPAKGITSLFSKSIKSALGWKFVFTPIFLHFLSIGKKIFGSLLQKVFLMQ